MKSKIKQYWFYDQLYLFNFRLVWPVDKQALEKYISDELQVDYDLKSDTWGAKALEVFSENTKSTTYVVALKNWIGSPDNISSLAHECLHITNMILHTRGIEVTLENDEATAYLMGYLLRQCLNALMPKKLRFRVDPSVKPKKVKAVC